MSSTTLNYKSSTTLNYKSISTLNYKRGFLNFRGIIPFSFLGNKWINLYKTQYITYTIVKRRYVTVTPEEYKSNSEKVFIKMIETKYVYNRKVKPILVSFTYKDLREDFIVEKLKKKY